MRIGTLLRELDISGGTQRHALCLARVLRRLPGGGQGAKGGGLPRRESEKTVADIFSRYAEVEWLTGMPVCYNEKGQITDTFLPLGYDGDLIRKGVFGRMVPHIQLVVVEAYNFRIENESLLFHEMCGYMDGKGFRGIDLCDPMHRPKDGALWQFDLFFLPAAREEFTSNRYS